MNKLAIERTNYKIIESQTRLLTEGSFTEQYSYDEAENIE